MFCILAHHAKWKKYRTAMIGLCTQYEIPIVIIWSRKLLGRLSGVNYFLCSYLEEERRSKKNLK